MGNTLAHSHGSPATRALAEVAWVDLTDQDQVHGTPLSFRYGI